MTVAGIKFVLESALAKLSIYPEDTSVLFYPSMNVIKNQNTLFIAGQDGGFLGLNDFDLVVKNVN